MSARQSNSFKFLTAKESVGVTVLNAEMSDFSYDNHAHEELAIGVTLGGVQEFVCNGSHFRSKPGDIMLFNPGDVHNGHPGDKDPLKYSMLYLDPKELNPLVGVAENTDNANFWVRETHFSDPVLRALILKMSRLVEGKEKPSITYEHCLYEMAKRFAEKKGTFSPDEWKSHKDSLLVRVRDYIHDNIAEDISIDDLSRVAHMSKFHLIRLFRKQFGLTPHKYLLNQRVNKVREGLIAGKPPSFVAQEYGFFDASHMNRHFKRAFGLTPRQYQGQMLD